VSTVRKWIKDLYPDRKAGRRPQKITSFKPSHLKLSFSENQKGGFIFLPALFIHQTV
jgi:hypothetical protein